MADEHEFVVERYLRRLGGGRPDPAAVGFYASIDQMRTVDPASPTASSPSWPTSGRTSS